MISREELQTLLRKALAAVIGALLGLILLSVLLIGGIILLLKGALLGLTPWLGQAGAYGVTGSICLALLGLFFVRLLHRSTGSSSTESSQPDSKPSSIQRLRQLIRQNPWEALLIAFTLGLIERTDPHLRKLLLQGGLALFNQSEDEATDEAESTEASADATDLDSSSVNDSPTNP
ncbi:hypothetical protein BFW38_11620 [Terasakiispira papahanaumokuakeensis]|uniref:Uncharacterized protein n=1 Tax=Terasakiispira papahanaumokuakeensis TaxID=197479 RepID=A0A1E2VB51_9GAMM|nr:hypothetical protein [Terasakiispira papahanaumokuakeensis]ODC04082.1 hypothetical protein BFW38_11620 [Terasakiispira papahanaumokuakeensis]